MTEAQQYFKDLHNKRNEGKSMKEVGFTEMESVLARKQKLYDRLKKLRTLNCSSLADILGYSKSHIYCNISPDKSYYYKISLIDLIDKVITVFEEAERKIKLIEYNEAL